MTSDNAAIEPSTVSSSAAYRSALPAAKAV